MPNSTKTSETSREQDEGEEKKNECIITRDAVIIMCGRMCKQNQCGDIALSDFELAVSSWTICVQHNPSIHVENK